MAGPLPWAMFNGVEVGNAARTLAYLRRGLGNSSEARWEFGSGELCGVLNRSNGGTCMAPEVFLSPAVDPAPWYDPTERGSASFLGLLLCDIEGYDSTIIRSATQRMNGLGGGTLSAQYRKPRSWKFKGYLISADDAGAEYGLRWLTSVLESTACDTCSTGELQVRLTCPPEDCSDDENGLWLTYETALVDGPNEIQPFGPVPRYEDLLGQCRDIVTVTFELLAGNPWRYKPPHVCLEEEPLVVCDTSPCTDICTFLSGADTAPCCTVEAPLRGVLGAIFTFDNDTSTPSGEIQLESRTNCGDSVPRLAMGISGIPAFSQVVVDCSRHTVTIVADDGTVSDGQSLIVVAAGTTIEWIEVADCEAAACLCARQVSGDPSAPVISVSISTQQRED